VQIGSAQEGERQGPGQEQETTQEMLEQALPQQELEPEVELSPGDLVDIRFFHTPGLNVLQRIRPDGKIALQLVGEVMAAGKSPAQLTRELYGLYNNYLTQLDIAILVEEFNSRFVSVVGAVVEPGRYELPRRMTALEAVMLAGGVLADAASYRNVFLVRLKDGKYQRKRLDLEEVLLGTNDEPHWLEPDDILYVPAGFTRM
jgi:protein involved in polysaccharide export with SLBB domain